MTLASRIIRVPNPFERDRAEEIGTLFSDQPGEVRALLSGTGGCSPYLKGLMEREAEWLRGALSTDPDDVLAGILAAVKDADDADLKIALRVGKRRVALWTALLDLAGVADLEATTGALTRFADLALERAFLSQVAVEIRRGRLPGQGEEDIAEAGGAVVLAMGKMGAFELNYSSDIDLICLFDESRYGRDLYMEARRALVRATQKACALLSETSAEGYVFRTDLRLRPDPSVTPVILTMEGAERYYESLGRTWERAAHIKARPAAGDLEAGNRYLDRLRPFIWRRHLDYAAIQDAHDMRLRIRDQKGLHGPITLDGHDMKLGRGGIREIEFFTQTRQIIAGGRDPSLRVRGTVEGLSALAQAGWIGDDVSATLAADYRAHREVEHRVQMVADQQTHALPNDRQGFARIAAMMDRDPEPLGKEMLERLERVSALTEDFFSPDAPPREAGPDLSEAQAEMVARWRHYPALRSERALDIFDRIRPRVLRHLLSGPGGDRALAHFDGFLRGLPAGVQLFSLFEAHPALIELIADIAGTSAELAQYLSQNSAVLDAVIGGSFFADWPGETALAAELANRMAGRRDYESRLDTARAWARDWHFRIGVHHLRGLIDAGEAGRHYADLAAATITALWPVVIDGFAEKHGIPPGAGAMVLGMGSVGAGRLTAKSDLDLIVIYDAEGVEQSDGPRPLAARTYYARLTQALVTALSAPMSEGRLYEVDMRLRPSGRQGPVATALSAFDRYQREEAWNWEHLALTRGRPLAGPDALCAHVAEVRRAVLEQRRDNDAVRRETSSMRERLLRARPGDLWDAKSGPGRLQDIELVATALGLMSNCLSTRVPDQIAAGAAAGHASAEDAAALGAAHNFLARFRAGARLLGTDTFRPEDLGATGEAFVLRDTGCGSLDDLCAELQAHAARASDCVVRVLSPDRDGD
ncbi:glutamate-ammonia-ligase adenylyltransferase [Palleronia aestuarii]|uniref:Glutamate-ammonia-ligase adenylyltransferase n=1 Tax=Palleronia aestuarii TaxID=568105 RepID=A0A2W7P537_9RHOB|nr:glutamine-synthetase adenylyltransferase [Palleronia aestuarii]PZX18522.1 glutamate-ammonia-ligase adenylyltransferase [Palleronia aestuarii]